MNFLRKKFGYFVAGVAAIVVGRADKDVIRIRHDRSDREAAVYKEIWITASAIMASDEWHFGSPIGVTADEEFSRVQLSNEDGYIIDLPIEHLSASASNWIRAGGGARDV